MSDETFLEVGGRRFTGTKAMAITIGGIYAVAFLIFGAGFAAGYGWAQYDSTTTTVAYKTTDRLID